MYKKLAELKVIDYDDKVVKTLEKAGFILVLESEIFGDRYYIIAESEDKNIKNE